MGNAACIAGQPNGKRVNIIGPPVKPIRAPKHPHKYAAHARTILQGQFQATCLKDMRNDLKGSSLRHGVASFPPALCHSVLRVPGQTFYQEQVTLDFRRCCWSACWVHLISCGLQVRDPSKDEQQELVDKVLKN